MLSFILATTLIIGQVYGNPVLGLDIAYPVKPSTEPLAHHYAKLPAQASIVQGFIRYLDSNGIERVISYSYPKPMAIGQIPTYVTAQALPLLPPAVQQQQLQQQPQQQQSQQQLQANSLIWEKAREAHFRAWSWQQYQALKRELDLLRSQGKQPSIDMLAKYKPLEKIALTNDFNSIAELPDIKRIRDEHLSIWQQGVTKSQVITSNDQYHQQNAPSHDGGKIKHVEQAKPSGAGQEHLRLWSETKVKAAYQEGDRTTTHIQNAPVHHGQFDQRQHQQKDEQQQQQLHISDNLQQSIQIPQTVYKTDMIGDETAIPNRLYLESTAQQKQQESQYQLKNQHQGHQPANIDGSNQYTFHLMDTPEVQKAREEHLRIFNQIRAHVEHKNQYEQEHEYEQAIDHEQALEQEQQQQQQQDQQQQQQQMIAIDDVGKNDQISEGYDDFMALNTDDDNIDKLREAERKQAEESFLQMESLREAQRLQEQQQQLEIEKQQEIERLMAEKRQMDDELMRLHLEDMRRLQMERLKEATRLKQDEAQIKQQLNQQQLGPQVNIEETLKIIPLPTVERQSQQQQQSIQHQQQSIQQQQQPNQYIIPIQYSDAGIPAFSTSFSPTASPALTPAFSPAFSPTVTPTFTPTSYIQNSQALPHISQGLNPAAAIYPATYSFIKSSSENTGPNTYGIGAGQQKFTYYILPISPATSATAGGIIGIGGVGGVGSVGGVGGTSGFRSVGSFGRVGGIGSPVQYVPFVTQGKSLISTQSLPLLPSSLSSLPSASPTSSSAATLATLTAATTKATKLKPLAKDHAQAVAKDLDELAKARREHFEAYNMALRQLSATAAANSPVASANANTKRSDTILPCN